MNKTEILVFLVFSMFLRLSLVVVWLSRHLIFLLLSPTTAVPNLFGTRDWFCGRQFFHRLGGGQWFQDDTSTWHLLCTLFLLLLHCDVQWCNSAAHHNAESGGALGLSCGQVIIKYEQWGAAVNTQEALLTCSPAAHLLLCSPPPKRPWTLLWPRGWGPLISSFDDLERSTVSKWNSMFYVRDH